MNDRTILTFPSRVTVDLVDPDPETIRIEDIAHALAAEGRFCNFTSEPWSVAAHSLVVALLCERDPQAEPDDALRGLLHDADEAYLRDLPGPLKHDDRLAGYRAIQRRFSEVVAARFGLDRLDTPAVKRADATALIMEQVMIRHEPTMLAQRFDPAVSALLDDLVLLSRPTIRARFLVTFERLRETSHQRRGHAS